MKKEDCALVTNGVGRTMSPTTRWQRSALVSVAALGLSAGALAQTTVGTISGNGIYTPASGSTAASWTFNGAFNFDNTVLYALPGGGSASLATLMGESPSTQFQFQASSAANLAVVDGNGIGGPVHQMGSAEWQILNTSTNNNNSTLYGPSATFNFQAGTVTGTLSTDGNVHWYYGYDGGLGITGAPGMTPLSSFGAGSVLAFTGTPTNIAPDGSFSFTGTVTAVPEPETLAMLLAGLGLVGVVVRRRTQTRR